MKKSILALAISVALPLAITSTTTLAEYKMHIAMETPQGGSLPQGSITFGNGGAVTPPVEPEVPTEPETPAEPEKCADYQNQYFGQTANHYPLDIRNVDRCEPPTLNDPTLIASFYDFVAASPANEPCSGGFQRVGGHYLSQLHICKNGVATANVFKVSLFYDSLEVGNLMREVKRIEVGGAVCSANIGIVDSTSGPGGTLLCSGKLFDKSDANKVILVNLYR